MTLSERNMACLCNGHYVSDVRRFLVKEFYLKLKDKINCQMKGSPEIAGWAVNFVLNEFIRRTKKAFVSFVPKELIDRIVNENKISSPNACS